VSGEPFLVFNPSPWKRDDVVLVKVWDREIPDEEVLVRTPDGDELPGQVLERGNYWGHSFVAVAFPVRKLPPVGYRIYAVSRSRATTRSPEGAHAEGYTVENEFIRLEVDQRSGAISSLVDKRTGYQFVPQGRKLGFLRWLLEAPHGMTAWEIGQIVERVDLLQGATAEVLHSGPYIATIRTHRKFHDSEFTLDISLRAGSPKVEFVLMAEWLERGSPGYGVPMLKVVFPLALREGRALFEIPFGHIERPTDGSEVPALRWVDLTGERIDGEGRIGATLVNDCKYGHSVTEDEIRLTLLRSSYDPDPLPELGSHVVRFALFPHGEGWGPSDATRVGCEFNFPLEVVATDVHEGKLPKEMWFISVEPSNVFLSGLKKAEEGEGLVVRLYETEGRTTEAEVHFDHSLVGPDPRAVEVDILERPISDSTARMEGSTLKVSIPAYGIVTVKVE
ncbi:MAG TPA: hypothetical protein EYP61_10010, partial [Candidatus Latescibacteria bacterium]|nr:hypothetical protein [Candidatus Latescibacterota bacterium]